IKTDILNHKMTYVYEDEPNRYINVDAEEAARLIEANRRGETPADLTASQTEAEIVPEETAFSNVVGQDDLTRFDKPNKGNRSNRKKRHGNGGERNEKAGGQKPAPVQSKPTPNQNKPKQEKRAPKPIGKPILKPKTPGDANAQ
ncbi:MAG: hypothetical protein K2O53_04990, partial [Bacteroidales bacterium]|nr:hypothetical protein [Bacteroidales bacterium]